MDISVYGLPPASSLYSNSIWYYGCMVFNLHKQKETAFIPRDLHFLGLVASKIISLVSILPFLFVLL